MDFTSLGDYSIVNTSATIDHEGSIGEGAHVMGGASLAGRVSVGCYSSIGTNATVLPDLCIGERVFLGAGAVLTKDTKSNELWIGVPARKEKAYHVKDDGVFPDP